MARSSVLIIGGGAAGLAAAIYAAREGAAVTVLEAGARVGRKILASGNGRCNLTNLAISPDAYNRPEFVEPLLREYGYEAISSFFEALGLITRPDDEGRVYPVTNAAASVLDVLRFECAHLGVDTRCGFEAASIAEMPGGSGLEVASEDGRTVRSDAVVVATAVGPLLAGLGHTQVPTRAVLGPIRTELEPIRGLSGVRVRCAASLLAADDEVVATERGELLFRDYGVSGIMVFDLSRHLESGSVLSVDLLPDLAPEELTEVLSKRCEALSWRTAETFFAGMLHERVGRAVLRAAGVGLDVPVAELPQARLTPLLKGFRVRVVGMGDARQSQVTRGGASVTEFDPRTMESSLVRGLFAAGEVFDVDGRSGGYNLHWAWASGLAAGQAAARSAAGALADVGLRAPE